MGGEDCWRNYLAPAQELRVRGENKKKYRFVLHCTARQNEAINQVLVLVWKYYEENIEMYGRSLIT